MDGTTQKTLKPGDRVSEYVLEALVGRGGFGDVWRARHRIWQDRVVAIKVPRERDLVRLLASEGCIQHILEGPGIVRALGLDPDHDPPYLVMEFVDGESLRAQLVRDGRVPAAEATRIARAVLEVLAKAHARGFVHRDLKPENVLIERGTGTVKLTDFGLGRAVEGAAAKLVLSGELGVETEGGIAEAISGTLAYMAPEQKDPSRKVDARADVYAIGILLFEMLTGARPEGGEKPSDIVPGVPAALDEVFGHCYCRYEKRYADACEALAALDVACARVASGAGMSAGSGSETASGVGVGDGPAGPARLTRRSDGWTTTFPLRRPVTRIGAASGVEVRLLDPGIAPEHAEIFHQQSAWWIRDVGSATGTRVLAEVPDPRTPARVVVERVGRAPLKLGDGMTIVVGDVRLVFREGPAAPRLEARCAPLEEPRERGPSTFTQALVVIGAAVLAGAAGAGLLPGTGVVFLTVAIVLVAALKVLIPGGRAAAPRRAPAVDEAGAGAEPGAGAHAAGPAPAPGRRRGPEGARFAGFFVRGAALLLDVMLLAAVLSKPWSPLAYFAYDALATWLFGATAGKWLLGLTVVSEDGRASPSLKQALGRSLAKVLSFLPWGIGFLLVAMNARKQALHDFVAETVVVRGLRAE